MARVLQAQVCVAGGGPAGLVHALLLARAGIQVVVLEKHNDFLRDFRGDTVHPTTLRIMDERGFVDEFLRLPHTKINHVAFDADGSIRTVGNFSALRFFGFRQPYVALMPQWDFLDFLAEKASAYPEFTLIRNAEVKDLIFDGDRVAGVRTPKLEVRAELVVAADGRKSAVRAAAGLQTARAHAPMDVLLFRMKWRPGDPQELFAVLRKGLLMAMGYRGDYWQVAYLMPKGSNPRDGSLKEFKERLVSVRPQLREHVNDLRSWDDTSQLDVRVDRLKTWWRTGLLCIGDAAHAMSPVFGVADALADGPLRLDELARRVEADPDALERLLRALISEGVFRRLNDGRYGLNPVADTLRTDAPVSLRGMARFVGSPEQREHWSHLVDAVKTGEAVIPPITGQGRLRLPQRPARAGRDLQRGNDGHLGVHDCSGCRGLRLLTVRDDRGRGRRARPLAGRDPSAAPQSRGVLYDLPQVVEGAPGLLGKHGVADRVRVESGSFFDGVPSGGDAYVLKNVIHDWPDEESVAILRNVRAAVTPGATLLLIEIVLPENDRPSIGKWTDMEMLIAQAARERTAEEYRSLYDRAGFELTRVVQTVSPYCLVEGRAA